AVLLVAMFDNAKTRCYMVLTSRSAMGPQVSSLLDVEMSKALLCSIALIYRWLIAPAICPAFRMSCGDECEPACFEHSCATRESKRKRLRTKGAAMKKSIMLGILAL